MTIAEIATIVSALIAAIPIMIGIYRLTLKRFICWIKKISDAVDSINQMKIEFEPNGGGTLRDAVNRIEMGLLLEQQARRATSMVLDVGLFETDSEGKCLFVNHKFSELTGLSIEEALGYGWLNGITIDDREKIMDEWLDAVGQNRIYNTVTRFSRKNPFSGESGIETKVTIHAVPVLSTETDRLLGYIGIATPIKEGE